RFLHLKSEISNCVNPPRITPAGMQGDTPARKTSSRLSRLLTGFLTLNLNSATILQAMRRIHCDFKNSILECRLCRVGLHAFGKGNLTPELSISSLGPVYPLVAFLVLVLAFAFQKDGILRDVDFYIILC